MKELVEAFPQHLRAALEIGRLASLTTSAAKIENVVISGLGGSGIGGKIVSQLIAAHCPVPVLCNNDYVLPSFVNKHTLAIISSYSGDTEETLAALHEARSKGAEVACITSGGKIRALAAENNINCIVIPGGNPPRAMFGFSFVQLFFLLKNYGLIAHNFEKEIEESIALIENSSAEINSTAKNIASLFANRVPVLYSEAGYEGVIVRWRQQINENAKMLCWHHVFPEMNHNELVGWTGGDNRFAVIILRNEDDHKRTQVRMDISKKLISEKCDTIIEVWSKGKSAVEQSLYLIHLGDVVSIELAEIRKEDAIAIPAIVFLKNELSKIE
ncbi:MAG: bifunctional phosphoglucose/phosphomannose isomerase [Crocinitomicaceae bacterium]|nr:bifunctional phosphoglucose/phosphomannose isomerase [Crocinitomicaceae bacterium]